MVDAFASFLCFLDVLGCFPTLSDVFRLLSVVFLCVQILTNVFPMVVQCCLTCSYNIVYVPLSVCPCVPIVVYVFLRVPTSFLHSPTVVYSVMQLSYCWIPCFPKRSGAYKKMSNNVCS